MPRSYAAIAREQSQPPAAGAPGPSGVDAAALAVALGSAEDAPVAVAAAARTRAAALYDEAGSVLAAAFGANSKLVVGLWARKAAL